MNAVLSTAASHPVGTIALLVSVAFVARRRRGGARGKAPITTDTWESHVFPHGELQVLIPNTLWTVEGSLKHGPPRRMTIYCPPGRRELIIHSAIAVREETLAAILALGDLAVMIVPNGWHRSDAAVYKARFPGLAVTCPPGAAAAVSEVVDVDFPASELPSRFGECLSAYPIPGWNAEGAPAQELVYEFRAGDGRGVAFVVTDMLFNLPPGSGMIPSALGSCNAGDGIPVVSRITRWFMISDKRRVGEYFKALGRARTDITFIIPGHGDVVARDCAAALLAIGTSLAP